MVRQRAPWMTGSDDLILEFLAESGAAHNLRGVVNNLTYRGESISYNTVQRRMPKLLDSGLVEEIPGQGSYYQITETGREYLAGNVRASALDINE